MSRNLPPRDSIAATHLWVPVDATGDDFYSLGQRFGTQAGVLSEVHDETGHPYPVPEGTGFMDPRCLRWHRLQRETPQGDQDNRLAVQILNEYCSPGTSGPAQPSGPALRLQGALPPAL
ncbi:MAG: hypothetical protein AB7T09_37255, partial [Planctomycetota bacterium]